MAQTWEAYAVAGAIGAVLVVGVGYFTGSIKALDDAIPYALGGAVIGMGVQLGLGVSGVS